MNKLLKCLRKQKRLSQKNVAEAALISRQFYNFIENGERRPSPAVAKRIASVLGFPDEWYRLLEDDNKTSVMPKETPKIIKAKIDCQPIESAGLF